MSADNWTDCPKCAAVAAANALAADERRAKKLAEVYGKVSQEEYLALSEKLEKRRDKAAKAPSETMREDYSLGVRGDCFHVTYRASCESCGFSFDYEHEDKVTL